MKKETNRLLLPETQRNLEPFGDYFWDFYNPMDDNAQKKVDYVLQIVRTKLRIPIKFFKHLEDGIYEIRIQISKKSYRVFSFFDENRVLILLHVLHKKTKKHLV